MKKKIFLRIIGIFYLVIGVSAIINTISQNTKHELGLAPILWFSYIGMILLGIGVLKRDSMLVLSQLNILGIPYLFWNFDFYYQLFSGKTLLGIAEYVFVPGPIIGKIITSQHLITIPLALVAIYLIGLKRKDAWKLSFIQLIIVFFITRFATSPVENVNCVYKNCANFNFGFLPYWVEWFVAMFLLVYVTNWIVVKIFYKKN
jgi:hypothetical protein